MTLPSQLLYKALHYQFKDEELLKLALTHRSVSGNHNNERLEFLGDSILGMLVAEYLYQHFPQEKEGRLTRLRATLVKQDSLAEIARHLQLGDYLLLGAGELKSGGFRRDSILADTVEAILGAKFLSFVKESISIVVYQLKNWVQLKAYKEHSD
mgnify:CR=1 FL=1